MTIKGFVTAVVGIVAFVVAGAIAKELTREMLHKDPSEQVAQGLLQATTNFKGPQRIDEITTLTDMTADGMRLTYHYKLDISVSEFTMAMGDVKEIVLKSVCKNQDMTESMLFGAIYEYHYTDTSGVDIGRFAIGKAECM